MMSAFRNADVAIVQPVIAMLLLFFTCAYLSFGIFTVPMETESPALVSKWPTALALKNLVYSPVMVATGILLCPSEESRADTSAMQTRRARSLALPSAALYLSLVFASHAVQVGSAGGLYLVAIALGVPLGVFFLFSVNSLVAWVARPGFAMSLVSLAFGLSQTVFSALFQFMVDTMGLHRTLITSGIALCGINGVLASSLRFPSSEELAVITRNMGPDPESGDSETRTYTRSADEGVTLPWQRLMRSGLLYQYTVVILFGRIAFGFFFYFFKLAHLLDVSTSTAVRLFQLVSMAEIAYAFLINAQIDRLYAFTRYGGRNCFALLFVMQAGLTALTLFGSLNRAWYWLAMASVLLNILLLDTQTSCSVMVAREVFGLRNVGSVYGIAGGIANGLGEALSTALMAAVESTDGTAASPRTFGPFYVVVVAVCLIAVPFTLMLRESRDVFPDENSKPRKEMAA